MSPYQLACLLDRDLPEPTDDDRWWRMVDGRDSARALWLEHEALLMAAWLADHPGRRPRCWWRYSAPREPVGTWPGWWLDGQLMLPRERLGGTGDPDFDHLAIVPRYEYGVPATWLSDEWADDLRRSRRGFCGRAYHPGDPPVYEAQASYLERHDLFLPGERGRLRKGDFAPEAVV